MIELVGGPFDGGEVAPQTSAFVFVAPTRAGLRAFKRGARGRRLYRQVSRSTYLDAGNTHARCVGCGGFNATTTGACQLCGEVLAAR